MTTTRWRQKSTPTTVMTGAVTGGRWRYDRSVARARARAHVPRVCACVYVCVSRASACALTRPNSRAIERGFAYLPSRHLYKPDALSLLSAHRHPEHPIVGGHGGGGGGSSDPSRICIIYMYICVCVLGICAYFSRSLFFSISEYNINIYIYMYQF